MSKLPLVKAPKEGVFKVTAEIIPPYTINATATNVATGVCQAASLVIPDPEVFDTASAIVYFPLEEMAFGLYGENVVLQDILESVRTESKDQVNYSRKRLAETEKKNALKAAKLAKKT